MLWFVVGVKIKENNDLQVCAKTGIFFYSTQLDKCLKNYASSPYEYETNTLLGKHSYNCMRKSVPAIIHRLLSATIVIRFNAQVYYLLTRYFFRE